MDESACVCAVGRWARGRARRLVGGEARAGRRGGRTVACTTVAAFVGTIVSAVGTITVVVTPPLSLRTDGVAT